LKDWSDDMRGQVERGTAFNVKGVSSGVEEKACE
jgi:hypothetical protein